MTEKTCKKCETSKDIEGFGKQTKAKDGRKNYCKECVKLINKERYEKNKEEHKEQVKAWQDRNVDKMREYKRRYAAKKRAEKKTEE